MIVAREIHILEIITLLITICLFNHTAYARYSNGNGTEDDPYQIDTVTHWKTLMNTSSDWDKHFILTADIDLKGITLVPVGNFDSRLFSGIFDGNEHTISNAVIELSQNDNVGLFGLVDPNGQIRNLGALNVTVAGDEFVGGLVGSNLGIVTNCHSTGKVSGRGNGIRDAAGGLVGYNCGSVTGSYSTIEISGRNSIGGLVGENYGDITQCYSTGTVSGYHTGGLVGKNKADIRQCYSTAAVSGIHTGGLVGENEGDITQSYSSGRVKGSHAGGLVGRNFNTATDCYSTGAVIGDNFGGGLAGYNYGIITRCYSAGKVEGNGDIGGLVGFRVGVSVVQGSFWDEEISGLFSSAGGTAKTTRQMKTLSTFVIEGKWDFIDESTNGTEDIWRIDETNNYPRLCWEQTVEN